MASRCAMSDSIDADLLDYYQRELTWLRHAGVGR